jgi:hypothetical protein
MPIMEITCDTLGESGDAIDHLDWEMGWIAVCAEADKWDREEVMPLASSNLKVFIGTPLIGSPDCTKWISVHIASIIGG